MRLSPGHRALHLELAPRYTLWGQCGGRGPMLLALLVIAGALGYIGWLSFASLQAGNAAAALRSQTEAVRTTLAIKPPVVKSVTAVTARDVARLGLVAGGSLVPDQRQALNVVIQQLNIPWHDVFEQLERATPADVALLSIEPDGQRSVIKIQAEAKSLDTLLLYAAGLQQQGVFGRLTFSKHETNDQDGNKPVRLSFELALLPPARLNAMVTTVSGGEGQP